ncbi:YlbF family regulator [Aquibacillus sp. 3ASR75-11]|uniref:YlbF family regulator n=1 Tax=Terrihalobacillus insolitus TaxID=2950438 RepID=A0A9X4ALF2_9BACI|nr:YlbF family regulator [Terrihalobacillus insolitus]MDC3412809.1 YlbF family regulator [Terrihalobacillus insolitus]MDC3423714.1 YlbF family regulator [Terrihalobacillus insolitus]
MIATMEMVDILDQSEEIGRIILQSDVMEAYQRAKSDLYQDKEAQHLISVFQRTKEQYEDVERFGRYHPDYNTIMKQIRTTKRDMDMNDKVAAYKIAERNLQKLLDEVSQHVAFSVSAQIKVPKDGAALTEGGCGCGSGSSGCGCRAS